MDLRTQNQTESEPACHVEVWFGRNRVCGHSAEPVEAHEYAEAMSQRFRGLKITIDDLPYDGTPPPLPSRQMWPFTVK